MTRYCNFRSSFVTFGQVLLRLVKFYNVWSCFKWLVNSPLILSTDYPRIFNVKDVKYNDMAVHRGNLQYMILRRKRQILRSVAEIAKYRDSIFTGKNICLCWHTHAVKKFFVTNSLILPSVLRQSIAVDIFCQYVHSDPWHRVTTLLLWAMAF